MPDSFSKYANLPSAIISDGIIPIPIWAVSQMTLTESYHLPAIGSTGAKSIVSTHDDSVSLSGVLVGVERFSWKLALETMAESSKRGVLDVSITMAYMPKPSALGKLLDIASVAVGGLADFGGN